MNKLYTAFIIAMLTWIISPAQDYCATEVTPDVLQWMRSQPQARYSQPVPQTTLYTPVHIHILGDNNGNGYYDKTSAYTLICELNQHYAIMNMVFFLDGAVTYIDSTPYYNQSNLAYGSQMMGLYNVPDVCNIYIVNYLAGVCGYAFFPNSGPDQGRGGIILKKTCATPGNATLAHEMGHYFSLPHTFNNWNNANAEFVDGSNCATDGDLFCDTPADFLDYRWNCPYTGNTLDPQGQPYTPDGSLFMSYSNEPCPYRFSPMQQSAIIYSRINDRPYLDNTPVPSFIPLANVNRISPANNAMNVASNNNAYFAWNAIAGALDYNLLIKKSNMPSFTNAQFDVFTSDTFAFINGLLTDTVYDWKVVPVGVTSTCIYPDSIPTQSDSFTVVFADVINDYDKGTLNISVFPSPLRDAIIFFRLNLSDESETMIRITDITGRIVYSENRTLANGNNEVMIHLPDLPSGSYFISFCTQGMQGTARFIKLNN